MLNGTPMKNSPLSHLDGGRDSLLQDGGPDSYLSGRPFLFLQASCCTWVRCPVMRKLFGGFRDKRAAEVRILSLILSKTHIYLWFHVPEVGHRAHKNSQPDAGNLLELPWLWSPERRADCRLPPAVRKQFPNIASGCLCVCGISGFWDIIYKTSYSYVQTALFEEVYNNFLLTFFVFTEKQKKLSVRYCHESFHPQIFGSEKSRGLKKRITAHYGVCQQKQSVPVNLFVAPQLSIKIPQWFSSYSWKKTKHFISSPNHIPYIKLGTPSKHKISVLFFSCENMMVQ